MFRLYVTFIDKEGDEHKFEVAKGDNLLDIAQANDLEMEGEYSSVLAVAQTDEIQVHVVVHVHAQRVMSL